MTRRNVCQKTAMKLGKISKQTVPFSCTSLVTPKSLDTAPKASHFVHLNAQWRIRMLTFEGRNKTHDITGNPSRVCCCMLERESTALSRT